MESLPPSDEALAEELESGQSPAEEELLPWAHWRDGRGLMLLISALGLLAFFMPWVEIQMPESAVRSGFDLARGRAGWLWGGTAGWLVLLPLIWTRRSVSRLRGIRVISATLALLTAGEAAMLILLPPHSQHHVPVQIAWRWGLYASAAFSLAGAWIATRLGGASGTHAAAAHAPQLAKDSAGRTLH